MFLTDLMEQISHLGGRVGRWVVQMDDEHILVDVVDDFAGMSLRFAGTAVDEAEQHQAVDQREGQC